MIQSDYKLFYLKGVSNTLVDTMKGNQIKDYIGLQNIYWNTISTVIIQSGTHVPVKHNGISWTLKEMLTHYKEGK